MASSQSFSMIPTADFALARAGAAGEQRGAGEDDGEAGTRLAFLWPHRLELVDHVLQEQQRSVVHPGQPGTETAGEAP